jgi:hypothetical protein
VSSSSAGIVFRYRDNLASPSVKAKPFGAIAAVVMFKLSATPITDPTLLLYGGNITKSPFTLPLPGSAGQTVYVAARWVTKKGLLGPWGPITSFVSCQA